MNNISKPSHEDSPMTERELAERDAELYGQGFMLRDNNGNMKRIHPRDLIIVSSRSSNLSNYSSTDGSSSGLHPRTPGA